MGNPTLLFYMDMIKDKIIELADSTAGEYGLQIVDVELAGSLKRTTVRVFIDKENGATLDDCEKFSRALSAVLDVEDPIQTSYMLEVSSPGLDRPLKKLRDFERNIGKLIKIITRESINGQNVFIGRIMEIMNENIKLSIDIGNELYIPVEKIVKAKLEIAFK